MPLQPWPRIHLRAGRYQAWIAPQAGGRLCRLSWHGGQDEIELVEPLVDGQPFARDDWPKQGAFPMLPYANRLRKAEFDWQGRRVRVRSAPGQAHGLHGLGHRRAWAVHAQAAGRVELHLTHQADDAEWPWTFESTLSYALSAQGLTVRLSLTNRSDAAMPAILGWHPYVPAHWLDAGAALTHAGSLHDLGADGLDFPAPDQTDAPTQPMTLDLSHTGTRVLRDWSTEFRLRDRAGLYWKLWAQHAPHLVLHVPPSRAYACIEPVTALPGNLHLAERPDVHQAIALPPGSSTTLICGLAIEHTDR